MGLVAVIIIFICLCTDNMVTANMSAMNMELKTKSVFSIKAAFYFAGFNALLFTIGYIFSIVFFRDYFVHANNWNRYRDNGRPNTARTPEDLLKDYSMY